MALLSDSPTAHRILYAPFSKDYVVPKEVEAKLTEDEFFSRCYVKPDFEREKERLSALHDDEGYLDEADDGYVLTLERERYEESKRLEDCEASLEAFNEWLGNNGTSVYCIKGDAGTGKTTFLHYLEYTHRNDDVVWEIVDLQSSVKPVNVYSRTIQIENFERLDYKVISALLLCIMRLYLPPNLPISKLYIHLEDLYFGYCENTILELQIDEVRWFFEEASVFSLSPNEQTAPRFNEFIASLCSKLQNLVHDGKPDVVIGKLLDVYMTMLRSSSRATKHVIAFDNIERFIGADEIYTRQIDSFIKNLRWLSDGYSERDRDFRSRFQFVVLMRNTSSRMSGVSGQQIDFGGHDLDLSGWFPVDLIVSNKIQWYEDNDFPVENAAFIATIIGDSSFDGCSFRSLQVKLDRILNKDKRIIVSVLDRAARIADATNPGILRRYETILANGNQLPLSLVRFAGRSIVLRLMLDVLREDGFFRYIRTQKDGSEYERLGHSRRILTILHAFRIEEGHAGDYMPFDALVESLVGQAYFDVNNSSLRETISGILYAMNYYNKREGDWLHLIDIQYNSKSESETIKNAADLNRLLDEHHSEIGLKIVEAGEAYLEYLIQSFEYFSCRYEPEHLPPLLCLVPSSDDLANKKAVELESYRVALVVSNTAFRCMKHMLKQAREEVQYRKTADDVGRPHNVRIVHSHTGYLNNFLDFVKRSFPDNMLTEKQKATLVDLETLITGIVEEYRTYLKNDDEEEQEDCVDG